MRVTVNRCDICGADDSPANPVSVTVTGVSATPKKADREEVLGFFGTFLGVRSTPSVPSVDLCQACGIGVLDILREKVARLEAAKAAKDKVRPAKKTGQTGFDRYLEAEQASIAALPPMGEES